MSVGKIEAVLFDFDGVLVDSQAASFAWLSQVISEYGYRKPREEDYREAFGMDRRDAIKHLTKEESERKIDGMMEFAKANERSYPVDMVRLYDLEVDTLKALSGRYKLGVVTNGGRSAVERFFNGANVENLFSVVVAREDVINPKPDPEPLLVAAKKLGIAPEKIVYVGDYDVDAIAGHAAGVKVIGFSKDGVEGADANVLEFKEIPKAISKLEKDLF